MYIRKSNEEISMSGEENHEYVLAEYEKKLQQIKTGKKDTKKQRSMGESGKRIHLLRKVLDLTLEEMAHICNLHVGKFTRLENGTTQLAREDAIRMCVTVLKKYGILIKPDWLLNLTTETPAALISTHEVRARVEKYTQENIVDRGIVDTMSIFLEMHQLEKIHGEDKTVFVMVSDNRLSSQYQKGDYVGGILVKPELYYLLHGQECIISINKDPDIKFVRTLYFKSASEDPDNVIKENIILLCTETKEPEIINEKDVASIAVIFYRRKNYEEFTNLLGVIRAAEA